MAIEHANIPEAGLHEPKGASTAAANRVYKSDGAGSGDWLQVDLNTLKGTATNSTPSGRYLVSDGSGGLDEVPAISYGSMVVTNNSTNFSVTAASDSTLATTSDYALYTGPGAPLASEVLSGVTFDTDRLTVPDTGVYKIDFWCQVGTFPTNTSTIAVRYRINGGTFSDRFPKVKSNSNNDTKQLFGFGLISLNAGDYIQIYFASTNTGNLLISQLNTTLTLVI